ncbi:tyrosine-protein phosphatase non-receptor type 18 isoform 1-T2 [Clarias gariepinus]|uniref:tyrosine-protein phosphatase non-receptor type 18 n=1 Tax=Clarias gariepinus TaxID=13013 RepID=UPI00234E216B|nr:tyrosine-protein phosphatase non-receptor type 18 [Clarias gariepinus]
METHLLKFIERVRAEGRDGEIDIASEYTRIKQQNDLLKQNYGLTCAAGGNQENAKKNRYKDILPYDQTRVVLSPTTPEYSCDYINANFIKGATESRKYIATQGPLSNTVVDFWRMIWEYDIKVIIMACKEIELGKKKCEVYWSDLYDTSRFGPFAVSTVKESPTNKEVVMRTLAVKHCDEVRTVAHFQYTAWPDHGIPDAADGILGMMESVHVRQGCHPTPLLVHCSAGCGRTGVICAIDIVNGLLQEKKIGEDFSIMDLVLELRRQRPSAVQTKEQYEFVFHTVAQMFMKVLQASQQNHQHQSTDSHSFYANVVPPKPALRSFSIGSENQNTRKPPCLRPRSSHPPATNMSDTYAVVNKFKQPSRDPPIVSHQYDNVNLNSQKPPVNDLYSIVKPKNRAVTNVPGCMVPVPDRTWALNHRASAEADFDGYEPLPVGGQMRDPQPYRHVSQTSDGDTHSDNDYEYVSNPIKDKNSSSSSSSSHCNPGGIGYKCRVKKPKGPRDPPSQWNRPER